MNKLWTLILFMGLSISAMADLPEPISGETIRAGERAIVTIWHKVAKGWNGKKVVALAKIDFTLKSDVVQYGHFFKNGALTVDRVATRELNETSFHPLTPSPTIAWETKEYFKYFLVLHPGRGDWVSHNYFKPDNNGRFYILGNRITTIAQWDSLGGVSGVFTQDDEDRLLADEEKINGVQPTDDEIDAIKAERKVWYAEQTALGLTALQRGWVPEDIEAGIERYFHNLTIASPFGIMKHYGGINYGGWDSDHNIQLNIPYGEINENGSFDEITMFYDTKWKIISYIGEDVETRIAAYNHFKSSGFEMTLCPFDEDGKVNLLRVRSYYGDL